MQKNLPKYTPDWIQTVSVWAEASKREVTYALCNDRRTLLWFANQRAVEYHVTLAQRRSLGQPELPGARHRPAGAGRVRARRPGRAAGAPGAGRARTWPVRSRPAGRRGCTSSCR